MYESAKSPFDADHPVWQLWWDFVSRSAEAGMAFPPGNLPPDAARAARSEIFRGWAQGWQEFMRSPEFLAGMAKAMEAGLKARQQWAELAGQAQHEAQGVSRQDFDQLMRTLRRFEEHTGDSLEQLAAGLADLSARLKKLEEGPAKRSKQSS
jgi:hypothetical protein